MTAPVSVAKVEENVSAIAVEKRAAAEKRLVEVAAVMVAREKRPRSLQTPYIRDSKKGIE
jgi:ribosomal protein L21